LGASFAGDLRDERLDATVARVGAATFLRLLVERQRRLVRRCKLMVDDALNAPLRTPRR